ncbi:MAG TPA: glucose-6-phosphate dehydrogenase [Gemmataceae bacterium]|jgi:glucose-6-phosphate 1-dehydrogenase|nr:glucose-6-phosphate dehydrogenase [Gemmataceae bacterium]
MDEVSAVKQLEPANASVGRSLPPQSCALVIFGAPGDLAWRKLLPAVYNLNVDGVLPAHFAVVGFGLPAEGEVKGDPDAWLRARAREGIDRFSRQPLDDGHWADFARALFFVPGSFKDTRAYTQLKARLTAVDQQFGIPGSRVYYLAVPPQMVATCVEHLKEAGLVNDPGEEDAFTRVIVEKPIGRDLDSAREVIRNVGAAFAENQTYRIDHYLGKETVQNLLVLRFANSIFEPLWNEKHIDHVQITVSEDEGVAQYDPKTGELLATRAGYYESVGALRDMVQNHMLQVLCIVAMEPPWSLAPDVVRDAKVGVLNCLRQMTAADVERNVVRGQYIEGDEHGERVPGYRKEVRESYEFMKRPLPPESVHSTTETFVALKLFIDNWRWAGVPFYLRTGKRLPKRASEVAIQFKDVPHVLFNDHPDVPLEPTVLSLRVQPEEGLSMRIASKLPGPKVRIYPVKMEFNYSSSFGRESPEAYERLILDVMAGDATLFMRRDAVESAWKFVMPILDHWARVRVRDLPEYQCGTWGPVEADRIIAPDGRQWRTL